jgi:hypothetical protein
MTDPRRAATSSPFWNKVTTCQVLVLCGSALISGCTVPQSSPPVTFMHPELLYLQDHPYTRLYVEVDSVQGATLPAYLVEELKAFLAKYCLKPDGIEVVLDPPIPAAELTGLGIMAASVLCTDGPPADARPQPAYLHLLVYDARTAFKGEPPNPSTRATDGPSAIFLNMDYARSLPAAAQIHILRHELGHVLSICQNTGHCNGHHCQREGCLMHLSPDLISTVGGNLHLFFREHRLCSDCEHDLLQARQAPSDGRLSFCGPFLVRQADGYCMASLLGYHTIVGTGTEFDWRKALHAAKAMYRRPISSGSKGGVWITFYDRPQNETQPERLREDIAILNQAIGDPAPSIRRMASKILKGRQDALAALGVGD